jgi:hypothetical protein
MLRPRIGRSQENLASFFADDEINFSVFLHIRHITSSCSSREDRAPRVRTFNLPFPHRSSFAIRKWSFVRPPPYASRYFSAVKKRATGITACGMWILLLLATLSQLRFAILVGLHVGEKRLRVFNVARFLTRKYIGHISTLSVLRVARYSRSDRLLIKAWLGCHACKCLHLRVAGICSTLPIGEIRYLSVPGTAHNDHVYFQS